MDASSVSQEAAGLKPVRSVTKQSALLDRPGNTSDQDIRGTSLCDEVRRLNLALLAGAQLPQSPLGFAITSVDDDLSATTTPNTFATRHSAPVVVDLLPVWPAALAAAGVPRDALFRTSPAGAPTAALLAILDAPRHRDLPSDEIDQLRAILRTISDDAGWRDTLALAADHPSPMALIWALLDEAPDQYVASCAPLLTRLTDLSLPIEPLARLLGGLNRRTPAADVAGTAAQLAPTSSSLTHRFAARLIARALARRPRDQVVPTLRALRDPLIRELLVIRLAAGQPQAFQRDCWSVVITSLDAQTPAWRLKALAAHVPRAFVIHLVQRAHVLANPVETIEVLCALAPHSASPSAQIRSALSVAHNLRTLLRGSSRETIAAAQRAALAAVATALDTAGMGAQHHLRLSAIRQAGLIRSGYERDVALVSLHVPMAAR